MSEIFYRSNIPTKLENALFKGRTIIAPKLEYIRVTDRNSDKDVTSTSREESTVTAISWSSIAKEIDFETLGKALVKYEKDFGFSTVEMFSKYLAGKGTDDETAEDWLDTYILYLGCAQVQKYSCP